MQQFPVWRFLWDSISNFGRFRHGFSYFAPILDGLIGNDLQIGSKRDFA